jgi:hypothetical protein
MPDQESRLKISAEDQTGRAVRSAQDNLRRLAQDVGRSFQQCRRRRFEVAILGQPWRSAFGRLTVPISLSECTHKITIGDSDLINVRFGPLCGLKSDIPRGPRSALAVRKLQRSRHT